MFLTLILTGLRRSELQALRWRDVDLLEGVLRVCRSKSEAGERSIALSPTLREVLSERYGLTAFQGDDELVFSHPERGTIYQAGTFERCSGLRSRRPGSRSTFAHSTTCGTRL